jgi:chromosome segregation ATPase
MSRDEHEKLSKEYSNVKHSLSIAKDENTHLREELERKERRLYAVNRDLETSMALAESRRQELRVLEKYLTTADTASASDVKSGLEALNAMIKHESANMFEEKFNCRRDSQVEHQDVHQHLCIGSRLVDALRRELGDDEPFMIRAALRATMVVWVKHLISSWSFTGSTNQAFTETYRKIYQSGK